MNISAIIASIKEKTQTNSAKTRLNPIADHQREVLVRLGRDQFKQLLDRGLSVPIVLL